MKTYKIDKQTFTSLNATKKYMRENGIIRTGVKIIDCAGAETISIIRVKVSNPL